MQDFELFLDQLHEVHGVELFEAAMPAPGVQGGLQEIGIVDAGDLHRILKGEEHAFPRAFLRCHLEKVLAVVEDFPVGDLVAVATSQHVGEGALAGTVGSHDGVHFTGLHFQIETTDDFFAVNADVQILDAEHG